MTRGDVRNHQLIGRRRLITSIISQEQLSARAWITLIPSRLDIINSKGRDQSNLERHYKVLEEILITRYRAGNLGNYRILIYKNLMLILSCLYKH